MTGLLILACFFAVTGAFIAFINWRGERAKALLAAVVLIAVAAAMAWYAQYLLSFPPGEVKLLGWVR